MRKSDVLDFEGVEIIAKNFPNTRATAFLDWFTFSDNSIDGQSRKKAYTLFESGILDDMQAGTIQSLQQIHAYLFGGLYDFAGQIRTKTIWKDGTLFCRAEYLRYNLEQIEQMPQTTFDAVRSSLRKKSQSSKYTSSALVSASNNLHVSYLRQR